MMQSEVWAPQHLPLWGLWPPWKVQVAWGRVIAESRLTCPFSQPRGEKLPVPQYPYPEACDKPVEQPQRQRGHGERTDPEERRLGPSDHLIHALPVHGSSFSVYMCVCNTGDLNFRQCALISKPQRERESLYKEVVASHTLAHTPTPPHTLQHLSSLIWSATPTSTPDRLQQASLCHSAAPHWPIPT